MSSVSKLVNAPLQFPGAEILTKHFGFWPDFHDANLLTCELGANKSMDMIIHSFVVRKVETDGHNHHILDKHCLVRLRFHDVDLLNFDGFKTTDIVFELSMTRNDNQNNWSIYTSLIIKSDLIFTCSQPEVVSLTLCDPKGNPL